MAIPKKETIEDPQQQRLIDNARRRAVEQAWKEEQKAVSQGKGSRDWTVEQQNQILKKGRVQDFEGHHMRSVSYGDTYQERLEIAGDKNNIQFLNGSKENNEHLAAHGGDTHNPTNGYYDVKTGKMHDFGDGQPQAPKKENLSNPVMGQENERKFDEYGVEIQESGESPDIHQSNSIKR